MEKHTLGDRIRLFNEFMGEHSNSEMINVLVNKGFFTAPASTKYHGEYEGGLFDHSLMVAKELVNITLQMGLVWQNDRSPYIVGMFHDLCKCDAYEKYSGKYTRSDKNAFPGHGDASVLVLSQIMSLTEEEVMCIRYHMGAYIQDEWNYYDRAIRKYPNVLWTHTADMVASKIDNI